MVKLIPIVVSLVIAAAAGVATQISTQPKQATPQTVLMQTNANVNLDGFAGIVH